MIDCRQFSSVQYINSIYLCYLKKSPLFNLVNTYDIFISVNYLINKDDKMFGIILLPIYYMSIQHKTISHREFIPGLLFITKLLS